MAIQNNLTSSSIRKYSPSKVISGLATDVQPTESWLYDDGFGDQWWQGAIGAPCRWVLTADVVSSNHSSHLTRVPNQYNGLDITPGMWVYADGEAKAMRIVSILNANDAQIQCLVEDVDRYNTFADISSSGVGVFSNGRNIVFFELGDDGLPILNPLPDGSDISTVSQVEARFRVFNPVVETRFFQINHGFKEGQVLRLDADTSLFVNATASDLYVVGTVTAVGPGPNYFYLAPSTKIIANLEPGLPGRAGDVIWLDALTGDRSTEQAGSSSPLYVKMTDSVKCFTVGTTVNPNTWDTTTIKLNNKVITFENSAGPVTTLDIIDRINEFSTDTGVTATMGSPVNTITGVSQYPMSTPLGNTVFTVNGITVTVLASPSVGFGTSGQIGWWDIIRNVNELTFKHGVYASFDANNGVVVFRSDEGLNIDFQNVTPLATDGEFKSFTDMIGVAESNPAQASEFLKLERNDGGQITITDVSGSFSYDTGIQSAANGVLPMGLVVDRTMNTNTNYVVADIPARDALSNLRTGDQVFVQSAQDGEWALFVKTNDTWTKIADQDSAATDANTLTADLEFNTSSPVSLGTVSDNSRIVNVTIQVTQAFNAGAAVSVGIPGSHSEIMSSDIIDLTVVGSYETSTSYTYYGVEEGEILAYFTRGGATQGSARIIVSYM